MAHSATNSDTSPTMCLVQWPLLTDLAGAIYDAYTASAPEWRDKPQDQRPVWGEGVPDDDRSLMIDVAKYVWDHFPGGIRVIEEPLRRQERFFQAFAAEPNTARLTAKVAELLESLRAQYGRSIHLIEVDISDPYMNHDTSMNEVRVGLTLERMVNA